MHYYKRNIGDYAKKAGRLSIMQHGTYTLLIDACYDREQFPTLEQAIEWVWASTTDEIEALKFVLSRFFVLENGVYSQKRIREEIDEYHGKAETNKRIALERESKRRENSTNRAPVVNEPPPNHKPITNNQEPLVREKATRGARLPATFEPDFDFAKQNGVSNPNDEFAKFCDYWNSQAGAKAVKTDWQATWRNWCRNSRKDVAKPNYEPPYAKYMREQVEKMSPSIAAPNPNNPNKVKRLDPNEFLRTIEAQNVVRIN
jgi:uncharacterized protein YdaU (DUF1376 family)